MCVWVPFQYEQQASDGDTAPRTAKERKAFESEAKKMRRELAHDVKGQMVYSRRE